MGTKLNLIIGKAKPMKTINAVTDTSDDLAVAHALADVANEIALERFQASDLKVTQKPDLTPVSDADLAIEKRVREILAQLRPDDGIIGEEYADIEPRGSKRRWVIDPIDGTKNYVRGVPAWASLVALMDGGEVIASVVAAPALNRRWWGQRGGGAYVREFDGTTRRIHVSGVSDLEHASLSFSSLSGWRDIGRIDQFIDLTDRLWRIRGFGDFWSYMMVAEGAVDIAAEPELNLYDMAALVPIVTEAGGTFTALDGTPGPNGANAIATNGKLHQTVLDLIGQ